MFTIKTGFTLSRACHFLLMKRTVIVATLQKIMDFREYLKAKCILSAEPHQWVASIFSHGERPQKLMRTSIALFFPDGGKAVSVI